MSPPTKHHHINHHGLTAADDGQANLAGTLIAKTIITGGAGD